MKTNKLYSLLLVILCCFMLIMGCDNKLEKETDPKTEPEPTDIHYWLGKLTDTVEYLGTLERYAIGEHSCQIDLPDGRYDYELDTTGNGQVPKELLDTMSTENLLETILFSSHFYNGPSYGDIYDGLYKMDSMLIKTFYSREDAPHVVINRYLQMYFLCSDNNFCSGQKYASKSYPYVDVSLAIKKIEILLAQDQIVQNATDEDIYLLSTHIVKTIVQGMSVDPLFQIDCGSVCIWLAARIMYQKDYKPFIDIMPLSPDPSRPFSIMDGYSTNYWTSQYNQTKCLLMFNEFIQSRQE